ncbi:hypothetical protein C2134_12540 [Chromobacterium sinusclupearum]|uniref:Uncharacterized protein n=1 Tax=Chromobacterium sinusclupearum TaxID=2077146 RepID=A0A2K4MME5_9NEIS|nr:hypothetical protein [Chromobacterium sinusclupearum]POA98271.1 hypothetical protein C2134_12540 [Chromobacterium sinusclupearum]
MSKAVDFPIREMMPLCLVTGIVGSILNATVTYPLFFENAPYFYYALAATGVMTPILAVGMIITYVRSNFADVLPCYIIGFFLSIFPFHVFFVAGGLVSSLVSPPIPSSVGAVVFILLALYLILSVKRSAKNILEAANKIGFLNKAYVVENGRQLLKRKELTLLDNTVEKSIFYFEKNGERTFSAVKVVLFVMAAMLGGFYKLFPDPALVVRLVIAYACFFITPFMIFSAVFVYYVQYKFPRMIFGNLWHKTCRETS